jgi:hypothetical protein
MDKLKLKRNYIYPTQPMNFMLRRFEIVVTVVATNGLARKSR